MIIQHALVGAGLDRDPVDARAGEAMRGKFLLRGLKDEAACPRDRAAILEFALLWPNWSLDQVGCRM